jgi:hypothetical protein
MPLRYRHLVRGGIIAPRATRNGSAAWDVHELAGVEDGAGTEAEIIELIRTRRLSPHDLVDLGGGWRSIEDCDPFASVCTPVLRREGLVHGLLAVVPFLAVVSMLAAASYPPVQRWLEAAHFSLDQLLPLPIIVFFALILWMQSKF